MGWHPAQDYWPGACSLCLEADTGVSYDGSGNVTRWQDQSHRKALYTPVTNSPLRVENAINGLPAIRFDTSASAKQLRGDIGVKSHLMVVIASRRGQFDVATKAITGTGTLLRGWTGAADTTPLCSVVGNNGAPADFRAYSNNAASFINGDPPVGARSAGGTTGEGEVGVGGDQESGWREFFKEQRLFGPIRAAESDQGVRRG
jgi:hypothetical protein